MNKDRKRKIWNETGSKRAKGGNSEEMKHIEREIGNEVNVE